MSTFSAVHESVPPLSAFRAPHTEPDHQDKKSKKLQQDLAHLQSHEPYHDDPPPHESEKGHEPHESKPPLYHPPRWQDYPFPHHPIRLPTTEEGPKNGSSLHRWLSDPDHFYDLFFGVLFILHLIMGAALLKLGIDVPDYVQ